MKIALEHRTTYRFDRPIAIGPHVIRLRPAPHTRTPIEAYSLTISPDDNFINWQQDPFGNHLARVVFPSKASELDVTVGLVADMRVINPFDFFIESYAESYPFSYPPELAADLKPYLDIPESEVGPLVNEWVTASGTPPPDGQPTVEFLSALNAAIYRDVAYTVRMEPGVQTPEETLTQRIGSCRDTGWLLVTALRRCGLAARFVSGYLIQLAPDQPSLDGASGPTEDFTDLHAWAEVYIPGAGWIGLDPTSALFAGEGHIPLAATPHPASAAAITGVTEPSVTTMEFANSVRRAQEDPRTTLPYTAAQIDSIQALGEAVDGRLEAAGLELTMGGEPTFVSSDDMTSAQWTVAADGPEKRELANRLAAALADRFAKGGLVQRSEGKWYPGEPLPRWQIGLIWRSDGEELWSDPALLADPFDSTKSDPDAAASAERLARTITADFGLPDEQLLPAFEDPLARLAAELSEPAGPRPTFDPEQPEPQLVSDLDRETEPTAWVLPLVAAWFGEGWASPAWKTRRGRLVLIPGESPAGSRLPLDALSWKDPDFTGEESYIKAGPALNEAMGHPRAAVVDPDDAPTRTALVVEARDRFVHVFLPPLEKLEKFVELVGLVHRAATQTGTAVILEGYGPPPDSRIKTLLITPDPGVIEVNVHPTSSWTELSDLIQTLYRIAREHRLCAETFALDGRHSGTGGGNHLTLGGPEPLRSPLLRRPDLLVSMITFWQHHPALSYLFPGRFVGPTSQAPRVDEGRPETLYELEISFAEIDELADTEHRPWAVDRSLRSLLTDITGNAHRAEFCIDKLYNPNTTRGRLGLLELRGFEMPPHPDMALVQALLVRALVARFAEERYSAPLVRWGTALHDRFLLPHFVMADIAEVLTDLRAHGIEFELAWLLPFLEFRFPRIGLTKISGVNLELRSAIEPWHVLGEEAAAGGAARYVDSSTERLQVAVSGFVPERHLLTCNGQAVPLTATGTPGSYVAGVRYKAWKPWSSLHPTLDLDSPLSFDLIDRMSRFSLGGATYHVIHPGGRSYAHPPVNASEAEARRSRRFEAMGHTTGIIDLEALDAQLIRRSAGDDEFPLTLDLRRRLPPAQGLGTSRPRGGR
jgi:uncharacterized protein (DUF2126 family)/transglutaminase-like putative cysteine protease